MALIKDILKFVLDFKYLNYCYTQKNHKFQFLKFSRHHALKMRIILMKLRNTHIQKNKGDQQSTMS